MGLTKELSTDMTERTTLRHVLIRRVSVDFRRFQVFQFSIKVLLHIIFANLHLCSVPRSDLRISIVRDSCYAASGHPPRLSQGAEMGQPAFIKFTCLLLLSSLLRRRSLGSSRIPPPRMFVGKDGSVCEGGYLLSGFDADQRWSAFEFYIYIYIYTWQSLPIAPRCAGVSVYT